MNKTDYILQEAISHARNNKLRSFEDFTGYLQQRGVDTSGISNLYNERIQKRRDQYRTQRAEWEKSQNPFHTDAVVTPLIAGAIKPFGELAVGAVEALSIPFGYFEPEMRQTAVESMKRYMIKPLDAAALGISVDEYEQRLKNGDWDGIPDQEMRNISKMLGEITGFMITYSLAGGAVTKGVQLAGKALGTETKVVRAASKLLDRMGYLQKTANAARDGNLLSIATKAGLAETAKGAVREAIGFGAYEALQASEETPLAPGEAMEKRLEQFLEGGTIGGIFGATKGITVPAIQKLFKDPKWMQKNPVKAKLFATLLRGQLATSALKTVHGENPLAGQFDLWNISKKNYDQYLNNWMTFAFAAKGGRTRDTGEQPWGKGNGVLTEWIDRVKAEHAKKVEAKVAERAERLTVQAALKQGIGKTELEKGKTVSPDDEAKINALNKVTGDIPESETGKITTPGTKIDNVPEQTIESSDPSGAKIETPKDDVPTVYSSGQGESGFSAGTVPKENIPTGSIPPIETPKIEAPLPENALRFSVRMTDKKEMKDRKSQVIEEDITETNGWKASGDPVPLKKTYVPPALRSYNFQTVLHKKEGRKNLYVVKDENNVVVAAGHTLSQVAEQLQKNLLPEGKSAKVSTKLTGNRESTNPGIGQKTKQTIVNALRTQETSTEKKSKIDRFVGDNHFLSNFHSLRVSINYGGEQYPTVEHFFQAMKTTDPKEREHILKANSPGEAKKRGRAVKLREDWDQKKDDIMLWALREKFKNNPKLKEQLLATGDAELIEGNTWGDTYWGMSNGKGENKLGKLLMQVRDELRGNIQSQQVNTYTTTSLPSKTTVSSEPEGDIDLSKLNTASLAAENAKTLKAGTASRGERSAGSALKDAVNKTNEGLSALFGPMNAITPEAEFKARYEKAKPLFEEAWNYYKETVELAKASIEDFINQLAVKYGEHIRPYLTQWVKERGDIEKEPLTAENTRNVVNRFPESKTEVAKEDGTIDGHEDSQNRFTRRDAELEENVQTLAERIYGGRKDPELDDLPTFSSAADWMHHENPMLTALQYKIKLNQLYTDVSGDRKQFVGQLRKDFPAMSESQAMRVYHTVPANTAQKTSARQSNLMFKLTMNDKKQLVPSFEKYPRYGIDETRLPEYEDASAISQVLNEKKFDDVKVVSMFQEDVETWEKVNGKKVKTVQTRELRVDSKNRSTRALYKQMDDYASKNGYHVIGSMGSDENVILVELRGRTPKEARESFYKRAFGETLTKDGIPMWKVMYDDVVNSNNRWKIPFGKGVGVPIKQHAIIIDKFYVKDAEGRWIEDPWWTDGSQLFTPYSAQLVAKTTGLPVVEYRKSYIHTANERFTTGAKGGSQQMDRELTALLVELFNRHKDKTPKARVDQILFQSSTKYRSGDANNGLELFAWSDKDGTLQYDIRKGGVSIIELPDLLESHVLELPEYSERILQISDGRNKAILSGQVYDEIHDGMGLAFNDLIREYVGPNVNLINMMIHAFQKNPIQALRALRETIFKQHGDEEYYGRGGRILSRMAFELALSDAPEYTGNRFSKFVRSAARRMMNPAGGHTVRILMHNPAAMEARSGYGFDHKVRDTDVSIGYDWLYDYSKASDLFNAKDLAVLQKQYPERFAAWEKEGLMPNGVLWEMAHPGTRVADHTTGRFYQFSQMKLNGDAGQHYDIHGVISRSPAFGIPTASEVVIAAINPSVKRGISMSSKIVRLIKGDNDGDFAMFNALPENIRKLFNWDNVSEEMKGNKLLSDQYRSQEAVNYWEKEGKKITADDHENVLRVMSTSVALNKQLGLVVNSMKRFSMMVDAVKKYKDMLKTNPAEADKAFGDVFKKTKNSSIRALLSMPDETIRAKKTAFYQLLMQVADSKRGYGQNTNPRISVKKTLNNIFKMPAKTTHPFINAMWALSSVGEYNWRFKRKTDAADIGYIASLVKPYTATRPSHVFMNNLDEGINDRNLMSLENFITFTEGDVPGNMRLSLAVKEMKEKGYGRLNTTLLRGVASKDFLDRVQKENNITDAEIEQYGKAIQKYVDGYKELLGLASTRGELANVQKRPRLSIPQDLVPIEERIRRTRTRGDRIRDVQEGWVNFLNESQKNNPKFIPYIDALMIANLYKNPSGEYTIGRSNSASMNLVMDETIDAFNNVFSEYVNKYSGETTHTVSLRPEETSAETIKGGFQNALQRYRRNIKDDTVEGTKPGFIAVGLGPDQAPTAEQTKLMELSKGKTEDLVLQSMELAEKVIGPSAHGIHTKAKITVFDAFVNHILQKKDAYKVFGENRGDVVKVIMDLEQYNKKIPFWADADRLVTTSFSTLGDIEYYAPRIEALRYIRPYGNGNFVKIVSKFNQLTQFMRDMQMDMNQFSQYMMDPINEFLSHFQPGGVKFTGRLNLKDVRDAEGMSRNVYTVVDAWRRMYMSKNSDGTWAHPIGNKQDYFDAAERALLAKRGHSANKIKEILAVEGKGKALEGELYTMMKWAWDFCDKSTLKDKDTSMGYYFNELMRTDRILTKWDINDTEELLNRELTPMVRQKVMSRLRMLEKKFEDLNKVGSRRFWLPHVPTGLEQIYEIIDKKYKGLQQRLHRQMGRGEITEQEFVDLSDQLNKNKQDEYRMAKDGTLGSWSQDRIDAFMKGIKGVQDKTMQGQTLEPYQKPSRNKMDEYRLDLWNTLQEHVASLSSRLVENRIRIEARESLKPFKNFVPSNEMEQKIPSLVNYIERTVESTVGSKNHSYLFGWNIGDDNVVAWANKFTSKWHIPITVTKDNYHVAMNLWSQYNALRYLGAIDTFVGNTFGGLAAASRYGFINVLSSAFDLMRAENVDGVLIKKSGITTPYQLHEIFSQQASPDFIKQVDYAWTEIQKKIGVDKMGAMHRYMKLIHEGIKHGDVRKELLKRIGNNAFTAVMAPVNTGFSLTERLIRNVSARTIIKHYDDMGIWRSLTDHDKIQYIRDGIAKTQLLYDMANRSEAMRSQLGRAFFRYQHYMHRMVQNNIGAVKDVVDKTGYRDGEFVWDKSATLQLARIMTAQALMLGISKYISFGVFNNFIMPPANILKDMWQGLSQLADGEELWKNFDLRRTAAYFIGMPEINAIFEMGIFAMSDEWNTWLKRFTMNVEPAPLPWHRLPYGAVPYGRSIKRATREGITGLFSPDMGAPWEWADLAEDLKKKVNQFYELVE